MTRAPPAAVPTPPGYRSSRSRRAGRASLFSCRVSRVNPCPPTGDRMRETVSLRWRTGGLVVFGVVETVELPGGSERLRHVHALESRVSGLWREPRSKGRRRACESAPRFPGEYSSRGFRSFLQPGILRDGRFRFIGPVRQSLCCGRAHRREALASATRSISPVEGQSA